MKFFDFILREIVDKLSNINKRLDYYIHLTEASAIVAPKFSTTTSGVTQAHLESYLIGNMLTIDVWVNLTSAAQTTFGTGNITNREVCKLTYSDIFDFMDSSDSLRPFKIASIPPAGLGAFTDYSNGTAHIASFYVDPKQSGYDLIVTITAAAVKAKSSQWRIRFFIPVTRPESYYEDMD